MTDIVLQQAKGLKERLLDIAQEHDYMSMKPGLSTVQQDMHELDRQSCIDSANMIEKLATEVIRLRLSIGHFKYGRLSEFDLFKVSETWNQSGSET